MSVELVGQMTKDELRDFVKTVVQETAAQDYYELKPDRPVKELLEEIWANMIELKPGQPSTLEMIRKDRDR